MANIQIDKVRLREMLAVAKHSDSVELKLTVPASDLLSISQRRMAMRSADWAAEPIGARRTVSSSSAATF